jgi:hypothetical protein
MGVAIGVDLIAVAVMAGRDRVEIEARRLDGRLGLGMLALVLLLGRTPGLHPRSTASAGRSRYASTHRV